MKRLRTLLALLLVLAPACARAAAWEWKTPPAMDERALLAELRARGTEKAVLVNFWATW